LKEITDRDQRDQTREVSPLVPARDAIRIDTTRLSIEQVVEQVLELVRNRPPRAGMVKPPETL